MDMGRHQYTFTPVSLKIAASDTLLGVLDTELAIELDCYLQFNME